jgi:hypothetical protein
LLSKSSPIQQAKDITDFNLGKEDDFIYEHFFFGIKSQLGDVDVDTSFWNRTLTGRPQFDENFDLSPEDNQRIMRDFCEEISNSEFLFREDPSITCPML